MAKKCYAVRKGNRVGIFYSWDECQSAVVGFSGAEYKGFGTEEEAEAYLRGEQIGTDNKTGGRVIIAKPTTENTVNIYTDGSYKDGEVSFGIFIETSSRNFSFYGLVSCPEFQSINNIAGELFGVLVGIQLAKDMGFSNMNIIYDYAGIEQWYNGNWQARGRLQSIYVTLMNSLRLQNNLDYSFIQVKGHSNVEGNKMADKLANRSRNFRQYVDKNSILRGTLTVRDVPRF